MDTYLMFSDTIKGEATRADEGAKEALKIENASFSVVNSAHMAGGKTGLSSGTPELHEITISRTLDAASPLIFMHCAKGKHFPKATITQFKSTGEDALAYLTIELENVKITSYGVQVSGSGGGTEPFDSFSLAYTKATYTYTPQDETGNPKGEPQIGSWDAQAATT